MTRADFVRKHWALAVMVGTAWGLAPAAILAHALKESGANNPRAAARHNYFGFLKAGKHLVYPSDNAGFTAYARRMATGFEAAARASSSPQAFAQAVAFSKYVNESEAKKKQYAATLASIYRSVEADIKKYQLTTEPLAVVAPLTPRTLTRV